MIWGTLGRIGVGVALAVMIKLTFLVVAAWYGDMFNRIVCECSFYGPSTCPDARPGRRMVLYGLAMAGILIGGIVPARLPGASWRKTAMSLLIAPLITPVVVPLPLAIVIVPVRVQR